MSELPAPKIGRIPSQTELLPATGDRVARSAKYAEVPASSRVVVRVLATSVHPPPSVVMSHQTSAGAAGVGSIVYTPLGSVGSLTCQSLQLAGGPHATSPTQSASAQSVAPSPSSSRPSPQA